MRYTWIIDTIARNYEQLVKSPETIGEFLVRNRVYYPEIFLQMLADRGDRINFDHMYITTINKPIISDLLEKYHDVGRYDLLEHIIECQEKYSHDILNVLGETMKYGTHDLIIRAINAYHSLYTSTMQCCRYEYVERILKKYRLTIDIIKHAFKNPDTRVIGEILRISRMTISDVVDYLINSKHIFEHHEICQIYARGHKFGAAYANFITYHLAFHGESGWIFMERENPDDYIGLMPVKNLPRHFVLGPNIRPCIDAVLKTPYNRDADPGWTICTCVNISDIMRWVQRKKRVLSKLHTYTINMSLCDVCFIINE